MMKDNTIVAITIAICMLVLAIVCGVANSQAKAQLKYIISEPSSLGVELSIPTRDTVLTDKMRQTLNYFDREFQKEQSRYISALRHNYPKQYILVWVILITTVIAAFLNLVAINKGWANIGKSLRVSLLFTVGVFMLFNLAEPVMQYDARSSSAYEGYHQINSLLRDIHYYGQSDGHLFLNDGVTEWPEFLSYTYGKIESLERIGLNDGISFVPGVKDIIERSKELTEPLSQGAQ